MLSCENVIALFADCLTKPAILNAEDLILHITEFRTNMS